MNITCSKPKISVYSFMRILCASLVKNKNVIVDMESIVRKIYDFKKQSNEDLQFLFDDIEFRENIDNVVSYDISEGLNSLQTFGVIGKLNPNYEKFVIYLTEDDANYILNEYEPNIIDAIDSLAKTFEQV